MKPIQSAEEEYQKVLKEVNSGGALPNSISKYFFMAGYEAAQYDYSKECKCGEASTGSTWCCNVCGLPIKYVNSETKERDSNTKMGENSAINHVELLSNLEKTKWISVDTLPEKDKMQPDYSETVIICNNYGYMEIAYYEYEREKWINVNIDEDVVDLTTHWMPLPQSPK